MDRVVIAVAIAVVAASFALWLRRRRRPDPPTRSAGIVPGQLDRADFAAPRAPWLVVAFTSATCSTCADVQAKVEVLASDEVAIDIVEYPSRRDLHRRYGIDAVPMVVIADHAGAVRQHFLGPVTATDLWAAVAGVRDG